MKTHKMMVAALAAVALVGTTLTLSITSNAQSGGGVSTDQGRPPAQAGPRNPGGPPAFGGGDMGPQVRQGGGFMGGMAGGGSVAIDSDNSFLYIVQGNMIFKVSKADLRVMARGQLMEMPQGGPGGQGAPGAGRFGPGQGGQRPPGGDGQVRPPSEG